MKKLRMHQSDLLKRAQLISEGKISVKTTVVHATPGAGKSGSASLFSHELLKNGIIDRVVWVCPRSSLAQQAADGFKLHTYNPNYSIRRADNVAPLFRDVNNRCIGYSTTYQSIAARPELHKNSVTHTRYLLILDEPHHLQDEDEITWVKAIEPLVDGAVHTLLMTGTIERHDKKLIPFIEYTEEDDRLFPKKDIVYSRFDALMEEAIVPIEFTYENGWSKFQDEFGEHNIQINQATDAEVSKVIQTFLGKTDFRDKLLRRGVNHWIENYKKYPSRAIVICNTQNAAREVADQIHKEFKIKPVLAISDESSSQDNIKAFRKNEAGLILVTVGMAYEGLDVPDCKHMICLTDTRSVPWLEQAFARVTRVDYKAISQGISYANQRAYIFVPDDPRMQKVVSFIREEQDRGIKVKAAKVESESEPKDKSDPGFAFIPIGASSSGATMSNLELELDDSSIQVISQVDEQEYRKKIEILARRRDILKRLPKGSTNKLIFQQFRKPRNKMGKTELEKVLRFLSTLVG